MSSGSGAPEQSTRRPVVVDANILVRAVLGRRVLTLLRQYAPVVAFFTPQVAFDDVQKHLPEILSRRGIAAEAVTSLVQGALPLLEALVTPVPPEIFAEAEDEARQRLARRDEDDWPYVALAMWLGCPIWTEDQDFFGTGIATWTTDRVELYLSRVRSQLAPGMRE